jgi:hypothetical protein
MDKALEAIERIRNNSVAIDFELETQIAEDFDLIRAALPTAEEWAVLEAAYAYKTRPATLRGADKAREISQNLKAAIRALSLPSPPQGEEHE